MHEHDFSYDTDYNEVGHYGVCECGEEDSNIVGHSFTNGVCECGYVDPNYSAGDNGNTGDNTLGGNSGENIGGDTGGEGTGSNDNTGTEGGGNNDDTNSDGSSSGGTGGGNDVTDGENTKNSAGGLSCSMAVTGYDIMIPIIAMLLATSMIYLINREKRKNG
jgi:hypothetical protein